MNMNQKNSEDRRCQHQKKNGQRCNALSMSGSKFCFFHNPDRKKEIREAQRKGGRRGKIATLDEKTPDVIIKTPDDLIRLLAKSISQVRRGDIDPRVANAIGYLSGVILKAREQGVLEERVIRLEEAIDRRDGK